MEFAFLYILGSWVFHAFVGGAMLFMAVREVWRGWNNKRLVFSLGNRGRWLKQHFGSEGARAWLNNLEALELASQIWNAEDKMDARRDPPGNSTYSAWGREKARLLRVGRRRFPWVDFSAGSPVLTSKGWVMGVVQGVSCEGMGFMNPWGAQYFGYNRTCNPNSMYDGDVVKAGQAMIGGVLTRCHGEPRAADWMAAGFFERAVDLYAHELARSGMSMVRYPMGAGIEERAKLLLDSGIVVKGEPGVLGYARVRMYSASVIDPNAAPLTGFAGFWDSFRVFWNLLWG